MAYGSTPTALADDLAAWGVSSSAPVTSRLDTLHADNVVIEGYTDGLETKLDTLHTDIATTLAGKVDTVGTRTYGTSVDLAVASASAQSSAITATEVCLHASTRCFVKAGANPTAVANGDGIPLEAGEKFHLRITSGWKIAAIRDAADGHLNISPVA